MNGQADVEVSKYYFLLGNKPNVLHHKNKWEIPFFQKWNSHIFLLLPRVLKMVVMLGLHMTQKPWLFVKVNSPLLANFRSMSLINIRMSFPESFRWNIGKISGWVFQDPVIRDKGIWNYESGMRPANDFKENQMVIIQMWKIVLPSFFAGMMEIMVINYTAHPQPFSTHVFWNAIMRIACLMTMHVTNHVGHHVLDWHQMK